MHKFSKIGLLVIVMVSIAIGFGCSRAFANTHLSKNDPQVIQTSKLIGMQLKRAFDGMSTVDKEDPSYSIMAGIADEVELYLEKILPEKLSKEFTSDELVKIDPNLMTIQKLMEVNFSVVKKMNKEVLSRKDISTKENDLDPLKTLQDVDKIKNSYANALCNSAFSVDFPQIPPSYNNLIDQEFTDKLFITKIKNEYKMQCLKINKDKLDERAESYAKYVQAQFKQAISEAISEKEYRELTSFGKSPLGTKFEKLLAEVNEDLRKNVLSEKRL